MLALGTVVPFNHEQLSFTPHLMQFFNFGTYTKYAFVREFSKYYNITRYPDLAGKLQKMVYSRR